MWRLPSFESINRHGVASLYSASLCVVLLAQAAAMPQPQQPVNCTRLLSEPGLSQLYQNVPCDELSMQANMLQQGMTPQLQNARVSPPAHAAAFNGSETLQDEASNDNGLIPVYCGVMGLVIFSSVVYAVVKQRKQHVKKRNAKAAASTYRPALIAHSSNSSSPASVCACNDLNNTAVYVEPLLYTNVPPKWYKESKSYLVSDDTIDALCTLLEASEVDDKGVQWWRKLATELNFDEKQICAAEYDAASCDSSPLRVLLSNLAHSTERWFTQSVLREALERVGKAEMCSHLQSPLS